MIPTYSLGQMGRILDTDWRTVLRCPFEGSNGSTTIVDEAGHALTANGNAQISTAQFAEGSSSLLCDGSGDSVTAADSADWVLGLYWRIVCMVRLTSVGAVQGLVVKRATTANYAPFSLYVDSAGKPGALSSFNGSSWGINLLSANALSINTWYEIEYQRAGSLFSLLVDRALKQSASSGSTLMTNTASLAIAAGAADGNFSLNGHMDALEIGMRVF